jgi:hypothetical protein
MPTIALLVEPGKLVGFLLIANPDAIARAPSESDCLFTGVPRDPSLLSHPLSAFVQEIKNSEYHCTVEKWTDKVIVKVSPTSSATVELTFDSNGKGHWMVINAGTRHSGICEFARRENA